MVVAFSVSVTYGHYMSGVGLVDWAFIVVNVEGIIRNEIKLYKWVESFDPLTKLSPLHLCYLQQSEGSSRLLRPDSPDEEKRAGPKLSLHGATDTSGGCGRFFILRLHFQDWEDFILLNITVLMGKWYLYFTFIQMRFV